MKPVEQRSQESGRRLGPGAGQRKLEVVSSIWGGVASEGMQLTQHRAETGEHEGHPIDHMMDAVVVSQTEP